MFVQAVQAIFPLARGGPLCGATMLVAADATHCSYRDTQLADSCSKYCMKTTGASDTHMAGHRIGVFIDLVHGCDITPQCIWDISATHWFQYDRQKVTAAGKDRQERKMKSGY
ncbi:hypothetical protein GQ44DRAFT_40395 [Phaeosphaeriaceae sp. PMI808]|nr:hypothetical protein GQ44DRAFT_40395 [Phaeosphaeriaceae sp. PMI808]